MDSKNNGISKSLRKTLEKSIEIIIDNHLSSKQNPFQSSVENIVDSIMESEEIMNLTAKVSKEESIYDPDHDKCKLDFEDFIDLEQEKADLSDRELVESLGESPYQNVTDQKTWMQEAKILRERLLSKNNDLFTSSYNIHLKLITHPQSLNEGILNIIKALKAYFLSTSKQYVSNIFKINLRITTHKNLLKITNILLQALEKLHKNYKYHIMDTIITQLMELITFPTYGKKIDRIHVLNYMAILDPHAIWFQRLCYNAYNRNIIAKFIDKNPTLVEYLVTEIIANIYAENECYMRNVIMDQKSEINNVIIRIGNFYHCFNMVGQLLCFSQNIFPIKVKLNDEPVCPYSLTVVFLDAVHNFLDVKPQKQKRQRIIDVLKLVLVKNSHLLNYPVIVQKFIAPLQVSEHAKHNLPDIAMNQMYIFEICEKISMLKDGYLILFGFNTPCIAKEKNKKKTNKQNFEKKKFTMAGPLDKLIKQYISKDKDNTTIADTVINFTTAFVRFYLNNNKKYNLNFDLPCLILNYCRKILICKSHVLHWYKSQRLVASIRDLYKFLIDQKEYVCYLRDIEKFIYTCCIPTNSLNYLHDEQDIFFLFGVNYLESPDNKLWDQKYFNVFILNLAENVFGYEAIYQRMEKIVTPKLENIWRVMDNQMVFLSGSDRLTDEAIFKFLRMVLSFTFSLKCFQILLKVNLNSSMTTSDHDSKPLNLNDLIDETIHMSGPGNLVSHTGLLAIKMLILNMDIYLCLEYQFNIQEKLFALQYQVLVPSYERASPKEVVRGQPKGTPFIIDECSLLRQEILDHISNMGMVYCDGTKRTHSSGTLIVPSRKQVSELQRFLKETKNNLHDNSWMNQARRTHKLVIDDVMKEIVIIEMIRQARQLYPNSKRDFSWPGADAEPKELHPEELIAVSVIIRYGLQNKLIQNCGQNEDSLIYLLQQTRMFLKQPKETFSGFDWFTGVVFLICSGNIEKSKNLLSSLVDLPAAPFIWPMMRIYEKPGFWSKFECNVNIVLHGIDNLDNILEAAHISVNGMVKYLLNQCFFNILEWNEICHFIVMSIIYTPDYLVYYFVAIFQFMKDKLIQSCISNDLNIYAKILRLEGFKMKFAIPVMEQLAKQFKHLLAY